MMSQSYEVLKTGLETNIRRDRVSFWRPLPPKTLFASLCCHEQVGWGRPKWLCTQPWEVPGTSMDAWRACAEKRICFKCSLVRTDQSVSRVTTVERS